MFRGARTTLFWLLLFALPLQGFAGGAVQRCDAMSMPASPASHSLALGHGVDADTGSAQQASEKPAAVDCSGSAGADRHSSNHSPAGCAGLAACGLAGAYAHIMPTLLHPVATVAPSVSRSIPRFGFLTGAPDRPPRTIA